MQIKEITVKQEDTMLSVLILSCSISTAILTYKNLKKISSIWQHSDFKTHLNSSTANAMSVNKVHMNFQYSVPFFYDSLYKTTSILPSTGYTTYIMPENKP